MGIMVYSLLWVMQDFGHQPYEYILFYSVIVPQASSETHTPWRRQWTEDPSRV